MLDPWVKADWKIQGIRSDRQSAWRTMDGVCDIVQEAVIKSIPKKKKRKKANLMDIRG